MHSRGPLNPAATVVGVADAAAIGVEVADTTVTAAGTVEVVVTDDPLGEFCAAQANAKTDTPMRKTYPEGFTFALRSSGA